MHIDFKQYVILITVEKENKHLFSAFEVNTYFKHSSKNVWSKLVFSKYFYLI